MGILIGMDEAGYGPNLGPLVVAATAWQVDEEARGQRSEVRDGEPASAGGDFSTATSAAVLCTPNKSYRNAPDLYRRLCNIVAKSPSDRRVPIADSKILYNPAAGLRQLERGLHSVLLAMGQQLTCWSAIVHYCQADPDSHHSLACWPDEFDCSLPIHAEANEVARLGTRFSRACSSVGVRPLLIRARLIFPEQFNNLVEHFGNKATALSHVTIGLLSEIIDTVSSPLAPSPQPPAPIYAVCDKHGGRNFYTSLLQHHFSEHWISPMYESHAESHYEWGTDETRVRVCFKMHGETFLPTALASMTAKYLRELAMKAFNEFWCAHVPDLRPTAGYYGDSRRFKNAIAAKQRELGIDDHVLWRNR